MRSRKGKIINIMFTIIAVAFWLLVWNVLSHKINDNVFLPSPAETFKALWKLSGQKNFWKIILSTFRRISEGFFAATICGAILGMCAYFVKPADIMLSPVMRLIKAVPVVSFIILALLWVDSDELPALISFSMVLPVIYTNVLQGFKSVNREMVEMSTVFEMSRITRFRFIYLPYTLPCFMSACKVGLGFCFKAGIAAEVIGLPFNSIGSELYKSKLYLMTDELFAWTVVIVLLSAFFEGICIYIMNILGNMAGRINTAKIIKKRICINSNMNSYGGINNKNSEIKFTVANLYKSYGNTNVLCDVNMEVDNNRVNFIVGESGVGKTTLLKIIGGIIRADKGSLKYETENYTVSMVFQENRLIEEADVYSNIYCVMGKEFSKEETDRHLVTVGMGEMGNVKVKELSGGMKRRVAIVRAMMKASDIILLDEPFKGLDEELKVRVMKYVKEHIDGRIVLMVSHDIEECKSIDGRLINLKDINGGNNEEEKCTK